MEGARQELAIVKAGGQPKRLKSCEVGFEDGVVANSKSPALGVSGILCAGPGLAITL
jgi:hypothetical protein